MSEREENIIFDFIWGNTYGLFGQGYHVMIKESDDGMYLSYSVDMKYGEKKLDGAGFEGFMKDMKSLGIDSWDGRTFSDSGFENEDTWRLVANSIVVKTDSKGANAYPPGWKNFLDYLHVRIGIPKSVRELPPEEMKRIREERALQYKHEEEALEKEREKERERERRQKQHSRKNRENRQRYDGQADTGGQERTDKGERRRHDRHLRHERHGEKNFPDKKEKRDQHVLNNINQQARENPAKGDRQKRFRHRKRPVKQQ